MSLRTKIKQLLIPRKNAAVDQGVPVPVMGDNYAIDQRTIEIWAMQVLDYLNNNGILEITSTGGSVTITDPFGPVTNLEATGGGGGGYLSLTGPGQFATPGNLVQAGGFEIDTLGNGFPINLNDNAGNGVAVTSAAANIVLHATSTGTIIAEAGIAAGDLTTMSVQSTGFQVETASAAPVAPLLEVHATTAGLFTTANNLTATMSTSAGSTFQVANGANLLMQFNTGGSVGQVGFFGVSPVPQASHPSTLADVITILTDLGLCA